MFVQLSRCRLHVTLSNTKYSKCPKLETVYLYLEITIKMPEAVKSRNTTQMQITNSCHRLTVTLKSTVRVSESSNHHHWSNLEC